VTDKEVSQLGKTGPRFFYGYIVVVAAFFILVISFGLHSAFGVFFKPIQNECGWSSAMISGAYSLSMFIYGVLGMVVGGLNDRLGPRVILTLCGFLIGLGHLLMSQVNDPWQLYLFLVVIGIGMSGVWVPQLSSVARWFVGRRSLMTGIVVAGVGVGQLTAPPVVSRLIAAYDWRLSYVMLGGVVLVAVVLAAQFLRRDPAQMGQLPYSADKEEQQGLKSETGAFSLREAASTVQFWVAFSMLFCEGFCGAAVLVHIVPHAIELEIPAVIAANILAVVGGVSILGNYVLGGLGDRIGNRQVFIIGFILTAVALFGLVLAREVYLLFLFAGIAGLAFGGMATVESPLMAWLFGLSSHGLIYGVVHLGYTVGAAVGPFVTGYIFDLTGGYQVAFLVCAVSAVVGVILTAVLRPTKKLGDKLQPSLAE
jgi:MFS family permease